MNSAWSYVRGFERVSLCDWPGYNTSVIFMGGCNMHCPTCHNFTMAWSPDQIAPVSKDSIMRFLENRVKWIDGVVVTGGEATLVPELETVLRDLRNLNMRIKLDTNGMRPLVVESLLNAGLVDLFAVDVKGPWELYPNLSGGTHQPEEARKNLTEIFRLAQASPESFMFRLTQVPILTPQHIETARQYLPQGFTLKLQDYVPPRRSHAETDSETRRMSGDMVAGPHSTGYSESAQSQRH
ncbi:anaerobic ribonucleoside-triphosphate reductase activating protein [Oleidesulfovibrio sp.]|uniref:anaerobic ribonucleoside-triphosphate reductase activating protein n=1 Tax=Oleidesulfovibrio sp. TaxID=2909707 RepID=UPI003A8C75A3